MSCSALHIQLVVCSSSHHFLLCFAKKNPHFQRCGRDNTERTVIVDNGQVRRQSCPLYGDTFTLDREATFRRPQHAIFNQTERAYARIYRGELNSSPASGPTRLYATPIEVRAPLSAV